MKRSSGLSLLILIFLSVCMVTFSLLSLSGATADKKLSTKAADHTLAYQTANTTAMETLSKIDQYLAASLKESENTDHPSDTFYALASRIQDQFADVLWVNSDLTDTDAKGKMRYEVSVNEDQILVVILQIRYPENDDDTMYQILSWKVENTRTWNKDTRQNVFRLS